MCITTTNALPSRNPCLACDFTGSYRDWTHLLSDLSEDREAYASLCDEHREAVDEEVREQRAMWDWSPGGLGWAMDIAPNEFPHPDAEAPGQFPDHPDGEGDDTEAEPHWEELCAEPLYEGEDEPPYGHDLDGYMGEEGY